MNIYVVAPAGHKTGGTELSHQLVKTYTDKGIHAEIAYKGVTEGKNPLHPAFTEYVNTWVDINDIKDEYDNVIIVPEIYTDLLKRFQKAKKVIWWMSVDNFERKNGLKGGLKYAGGYGWHRYTHKLRIIKKYLQRELRDHTSELYLADMHLYQSEYARLHLLSYGLKNVYQLSDYINDSYFAETEDREREDRVLYNPSKGMNFTRKLMKRYPDLNWFPLRGLSTTEVGGVLRSSKVYIDFGNHPGKDRFPREAAICGCCVITGLEGAAANDIDINIPYEFKFEANQANIPHIYKKLRECIESYEDESAKFSDYRSKIKKEKRIFEADAMHIISLLENMDAG